MIAWVPVTVGAAALQVVRNGAQRSLLTGAGPWGATLVRFLFGLPFALVFALAARVADPTASMQPNLFWLVACSLGAAAQVGATAALLVCMRRGGFALGTAMQQSSIPLAALVGLALGEPLAPVAWVGVSIVAACLAALGWPRPGSEFGGWGVASLGLIAGAGFAAAANAFRQAELALAPGHALLAAQITVVTVQTLQSAAIVVVLTVTDRRALLVALTSWRTSIPAGFFGAAASALWFTAFALTPAGPVRAVGAAESPLAALAGRRFFAERLSPTSLTLVILTAAGVLLAALGAARH